MADAIRILVNEAMKLERSAFLEAQPHERAESRRGYVTTRVGDIEFAVPQVRNRIDGERFYPSALERGIRSERALKLAVAEMYVQGVSTRKVAAITEELWACRCRRRSSRAQRRSSTKNSNVGARESSTGVGTSSSTRATRRSGTAAPSSAPPC